MIQSKQVCIIQLIIEIHRSLSSRKTRFQSNSFRLRKLFCMDCWWTNLNLTLIQVFIQLVESQLLGSVILNRSLKVEGRAWSLGVYFVNITKLKLQIDSFLHKVTLFDIGRIGTCILGHHLISSLSWRELFQFCLGKDVILHHSFL